MWLVHARRKIFKMFFKFRKTCAVQNQIWNILIGNIEENKQMILTFNFVFITKISLMRDKAHQNMT